MDHDDKGKWIRLQIANKEQRLVKYACIFHNCSFQYIFFLAADSLAEKSLHMNPPASATISWKVHEAVTLMVDRNKKCSYKELVTFLANDIQLDVERHNEKIKTILKQMFSDEEIVPLRRGVKPTLNVLFRLGSNKKKTISVKKRKSIMMAEKKKKQNAKKTTSDKVAASKTISKKTTVESDLEDFEDDEDVPPIHR